VWNNWKDMLLAETYLRAQELFARGLEPEDRAERIGRIRQRTLAAVRRERSVGAAAEVGHFLDTMPSIYLLTTPESVIPEHAALVKRARAEGLATSVVHHPANEYSEFTVATHDRPGLFAIFTGVLSASNMNIVGAQIATSSDGIALDVFRVSHLELREIALDEERWLRVRELLEDVLAGRKVLEEVLARVQRPGILVAKYKPRVSTEVVVDNSASSEYTVLDIYTHDRIGLLHRIADTLFGLGLAIHIAKITTNVDQVLDVFYVTEASGGKTERVEEIRAALFAALRNHEPSARAGAAPASSTANPAPA
jgi:[protein-PII] uridylyltransferase